MNKIEACFSPWQIKISDDDADIAICGEQIKIAINSKRNVSVTAFRRTENIKEKCFYRISYELSSDIRAKIICGWYDKNNNLISREYAENGDRVISPEGAETLELALTVSSINSGACRADKLNVIYEGEYTPKKINAAAIALKYNRQFRTPEKNMSETLEKIDKLCAERQMDIIVLTECMYDRWTNLSRNERAIQEDSEPIKALCNKAKQYSTYLAFSVKIKENGNIYNRAILVNRKGEIEGRYNKTHLTMSEYEAALTPGEGIKVFDTDIGRICMIICWDLFFPAASAQIQKLQPDIICYPTAGYDEIRVIQRARETGSYIIVSAVDQYSETVIIDPEGNKIACAEDNNGIAFAGIDINKPYYTYWLSYPADTIAKNIYYNEARWDLYAKD